MGPIALFDKSFLQSLSLDESVWFDKFFMPVICPIFYVETLADLAKAPTSRTAEEAVRIIAQKTPELSGGPCAFHEDLAEANLFGEDIPMDGRIPRTGARPVSGGGQTGVVFNVSPESKAFARWQDEDFLEVERLFAARWRQSLAEADLHGSALESRDIGARGKNCASLEQAWEVASGIVNDRSNPLSQLGIAVRFLNVPRQYHSELIERWKDLGRPQLSVFAPYTAHVLTVEMFFHISIAAGLISDKRPSNRTDIAYLFYLPFCMMFISNDKLHRRTANLFLRSDQEFIWGPDLKDDLKRLNKYFLGLPEEEQNQGVTGIARHPPVEGNYLTTALWRRLMDETAFSQRDNGYKITSEGSKQLMDQFNAFVQGETLSQSMIPKPEDVEAMAVERRIQRRKGSWYLVPKDLPNQYEE